MNLFLIAYGAIPRGGSIDVVLEQPDGEANFTLTAKGKMMRVPPKLVELLSGTVEGAIDAHSILPTTPCCLPTRRRWPST